MSYLDAYRFVIIREPRTISCLSSVRLERRNIGNLLYTTIYKGHNVKIPSY